MNASRLVIFTDLDGTLIDFETYSTDVAKPLFKQLAQAGMPIVFCSSKTIAEQRNLQQRFGYDMPCIVENGSAVVVPPSFWTSSPAGSVDSDGWTRLCLGLPAAEIRYRLQKIEAAIGESLGGFSRMEVEDVARMTGLDLMSARRAQERDYSETLAVDKPNPFWDSLAPLFAEHGLACLHGGRFRTVTGAASSKGEAVRRFIELYETDRGIESISIGLGDSRNDASLFEAVDTSYQVQRPDGTWTPIDQERIERVEGVGPRGWVRALEGVLAGAALQL